MAKRRRKGGHARGRRRTHRRHRSGFFRDNPPSNVMGVVKSTPRFLLRGVGLGAFGVVGKVGARKVRGMFGQGPGELVGSLIEVGTGVVVGSACRLIPVVGELMGEGILAGAVMAAGETQIQRLGIPHVSDSLGDDGYYVGGSTGLGLVSAEPDDYKGAVGDFVSGPGAGSPIVEQYLAGFVSGDGMAA